MGVKKKAKKKTKTIHICMFGCGGKKECKKNCPQAIESKRFKEGLTAEEFKDVLEELDHQLTHNREIPELDTTDKRVAFVSGLTLALLMLSPAMTKFRLSTGQINRDARLHDNG